MIQPMRIRMMKMGGALLVRSNFSQIRISMGVEVKGFLPSAGLTQRRGGAKFFSRRYCGLARMVGMVINRESEIVNRKWNRIELL